MLRKKIQFSGRMTEKEIPKHYSVKKFLSRIFFPYVKRNNKNDLKNKILF